MPDTYFDFTSPVAGPFFMALGGAGEIGANFYIYGSNNYWIAVDCGLGFINRPSGEPGLVIPDLTSLLATGIKIQALLITHGHEDHIGAIPNWLYQLDCPIYATPFTAGLIAQKLKKRHAKHLHFIEPLKSYTFGPFVAEWIPVTHSILEAQGLYLKVAGRSIYHTGDWKLDPEPVLGKITAISRLQSIGHAGIDVVVGDSTNAPLSGHSLAEGAVQRGLLEQIQRLNKRVVVTCFASNLARIYSLGQAALATGRRISLLGPSMHRVHNLGQKLDYLDGFPALTPEQDLGYLPRAEQLIVCTGSQGEPNAALAKLAAGKHRALELEAGDAVIFSSKTIPGNEEAVAQLYAQLEKLGVQLILDTDAPVHASGHPSQAELEQLYSWLKPKHLLAMHGEAYHQDAHCAFAASLDINSISCTDGEVYNLSAAPKLIDKLEVELIELARR